MSITRVVLLAGIAIVGILFVFFHDTFLGIFFNIKDSIHDFIKSLKYGNFTEREETIANVYLNYHYPVYSPYRSYCWNCETEVNSADSPRCPICGIYICLNCGACHPNCTNRDEKIYISEKEARAMLQGKKKKPMKNRIKSVSERANDKIYYCERVEKEFGPVEQVQNKLMKKTQKEKEKAEKKTKDK